MKIWILRFGVVAAVAMATIVLRAREDERRNADFRGATGWLNSEPLDAKALRGKVVLVNFWTYTCINSLRELPYLKAWAAKYKDAGLVVIGVHAPEFAVEKNRRNVETATRDLGITFPVAIDSKHAIWYAFSNDYWPADYFIDAKGRIRHHHFGEGDYAQSERMIQELLRENGVSGFDQSLVGASGQGIEAPPSGEIQSPETYVGYDRAERFVSPGRFARDSRKTYAAPERLSLNQWALTGQWNVGPESAVADVVMAKIVFRFRSRDLHMVLGPSKNGRPIRFRVKLNGDLPEADHGIDTRNDGTGEISQPRLYQLIRQKGPVQERTFEIEFLDPGAEVFSFTFG